MVGMRIKDGSSPSTRSISKPTRQKPWRLCVQCRATQGSLFQRRVPGCLHSLNKSGGIDSHFLKMLGQAWKLYTIHAPIAQLVEQWTFNPRVVRSSRTGGTNSNLLL